jgi:hypothetical protein
MKLTIEEVVQFISFIRRADNESQLSSISFYGTNELGYSADEAGEDPYYDWVTLWFEDDDGETHEIGFPNTTLYKAHEAMWNIVDAIPI